LVESFGDAPAAALAGRCGTVIADAAVAAGALSPPSENSIDSILWIGMIRVSSSTSITNLLFAAE
jgi:hypothetical protein